MTNELAIKILTGDVLGTSEQTQEAVTMAVKALSQPDVPDTNVGDCSDCIKHGGDLDCDHVHCHKGESAQPEQRYTEEELRVFQHGISLSLLSKRSAQHWRYDEDTATEIKFLERLYEKIGADIRGEEV